jgi:hypothetical protein
MSCSCCRVQRSWFTLIVLVLALSAGVAAQIIGGGGGGGGTAPSTPLPGASDDRIKLATKFAAYYRTGSVGDAMRELADMNAIFKGMFGEDWANSPVEEQDEITALYLEAMNLGHTRGPNEIPDPVSAADIAVTESQPNSARVGITFRTNSSPTRFVLRMEKRDASPDGKTPAGWKLVDGYAVGEDSWIDNLRKPYVRMRGRSTPVVFMRQVHEAISAAAEQKRASTRPAR